MSLNPNLSFRKFMKAAMDAAETELLESNAEEDKCGWCRWYHPENETCQKMKESTRGAGCITDHHRSYCSFSETREERS